MAKFTSSQIRNICLVGHSGDGKTSFAEAMLYLAKVTDRLGKPSEGNTVCDFDPEEIKRGYSISTSLASLEWKGTKINLLDAPGMFGFAGESKAAASVAASTVIVVDAKSGCKVGTELAWEVSAGKPKAFFVNKIDDENSNFALFTKLGFQVIQSPESDHALYASGQRTIPSDTACYPAKLMHGHVEWLLRQNVDAIFYPCMSYNLDEHRGDNHYNCPVVAYYPEVLRLNVPGLKRTRFISDYLGIHRPKDFEKKFPAILDKYFPGIPAREVKAAVREAYGAYEAHMARVRARGAELLAEAKAKGLPVVVLCGRPYHIDPEISHGIDQQIAQLGAVVVTEDSVNLNAQKFSVNVLNQWTYHSRLYSAAKYVAECGDPKVNLVQLVSFGCGVDAITTDEVRSILQSGGRLYTQLKIDEISNPGAVRIRLRSLFAALEQ